MNEIILNVEGMHCEGCETRIKNSLKQINGVENVVANYNDGIVRIILNKEIDIKVVIEKIEDIGFEVKNNNV